MTRSLILLVCLTALAAPAAAQSRGESFAGGSLGADIQHHPDVSVAAPVQIPNLNGASFTGSVLAGLFLGRDTSLRVEQSWSGERHDAVALSGQSDVFDAAFEQTFRTSTTFVAAAYHLPSPSPARLALLGGVVIARERLHTRADITLTLPPGIVVPVDIGALFDDSSIDLTTTRYRTGVGLGADLEWSAGPRLTIAPGIRVLSVGSLLLVRPGVAVRWTF